VDWPDNPVLLEVRRSGFLESVHRGAVVVLGADGGVLASAGAVDRPVLPRSSILSPRLDMALQLALLLLILRHRELQQKQQQSRHDQARG